MNALKKMQSFAQRYPETTWVGLVTVGGTAAFASAAVVSVGAAFSSFLVGLSVAGSAAVALVGGIGTYKVHGIEDQKHKDRQKQEEFEAQETDWENMLGQKLHSTHVLKRELETAQDAFKHASVEEQKKIKAEHAFAMNKVEVLDAGPNGASPKEFQFAREIVTRRVEPA